MVESRWRRPSASRKSNASSKSTLGSAFTEAPDSSSGLPSLPGLRFRYGSPSSVRSPIVTEAPSCTGPSSSSTVKVTVAREVPRS